MNFEDSGKSVECRVVNACTTMGDVIETNFILTAKQPVSTTKVERSITSLHSKRAG